MQDPAATPVTIPVEASIVAVLVAELLQEPPDTPSVNVEVKATQTFGDDGDIAVGAVLTVKVVVAAQPLME